MLRDILSIAASMAGGFVLTSTLLILSGCGDDGLASENDKLRQRAEVAESRATKSTWIGVLAGIGLLIAGIAIGSKAKDADREPGP